MNKHLLFTFNFKLSFLEYWDTPIVSVHLWKVITTDKLSKLGNWNFDVLKTQPVLSAIPDCSEKHIKFQRNQIFTIESFNSNTDSLNRAWKHTFSDRGHFQWKLFCWSLNHLQTMLWCRQYFQILSSLFCNIWRMCAFFLSVLKMEDLFRKSHSFT